MTGATSNGSQTAVYGQGRRRGTAAGPAHAPGGGHADRRGIRGHRGSSQASGAGPQGLHRPGGAGRRRERLPPGGRESLRRALVELMRAAGLVRRIGTNINQAVAKLNATGQPAGDLPGYAAGTIRRADHIDEVADAVRKALE